jgi:hypothetical protein
MPQVFSVLNAICFSSVFVSLSLQSIEARPADRTERGASLRDGQESLVYRGISRTHGVS